jgi:hypothetical protein
MDYIQKAKDYAVQWSEDSKGDQEFIFDKIGLEYFLDSLNIDFLAEPPKKEWVGLMDEERIDVLHSGDKEGYLEYAKGIEAKIKEKNT